jgi:DNA-binding LytR/AlgR family response regulator
VISAIAIDDEPLPLDILEAYCSEVDFLKLDRTFTNTVEAKKYLEMYPVDLLFLDINMPAISGIDFYKSLNTETMVIFTTAHSEYAVQGFELNAVDYLLKPYSFERFQTAIQKAKDFYNYLHSKQSADQKHIFIRSEYNLLKIFLSEILYIEGLSDYLKIHLSSGKLYLTRMTMKGILSKLPEKEFIRIHKSFIVPFDKIQSVRNKAVQLKGGKELPIGASFEEEFQRVFKA